MLWYNIFAGFLTLVAAGPATESYKGQYCTDPRTMLKHPAYTEWADAYSCTRHRCQPGGRNLAIYTVGCKRVEAPESAIECEEVVEDTNMQFPFCCTRLRCLVVVRGEVWTRVLGQPWETLPAAPWSHMYKMKRPPPGAGELPGVKPAKFSEGPVYELAKPDEEAAYDEKARSEKAVHRAKKSDNSADCTDKENAATNELAPRAAPAPDIVIALSTNDEHEPTKESRKKERESTDRRRRRRGRKHSAPPVVEEVPTEAQTEAEYLEETQFMQTEKEKPIIEPHSDERDRYIANSYGVTQKTESHQEVQLTEAPLKMELLSDLEPVREHPRESQDPQPTEPPKEADKSGNLQALVDAIGSRMRDIEHVVRRMSDKVGRAQPNEGGEDNQETRHSSGEREIAATMEPDPAESSHRTKRPNTDNEHYKRFTGKHSSKYLQAEEGSTEPPLIVEDSHLGYFSDASNTVLRRAPKEPNLQAYAPVETRRRAHPLLEDADDEKKKKKHSHKKKKGHHKKHHVKEEKKKRLNRLSSQEVDKNVISLEDSSGAAVA